MKQFYLSIVLICAIFCSSKLHSQITCNFTLVDSVECNVLGIQATAAEVSGSAIVSRSWSLALAGGGTVNASNTQNFAYIANSCGQYFLTLQSTNSNGQSCTVTKPLRVACEPTISLTFNPTVGCLPFTTSSPCNIDPVDGTLTNIDIAWGCGGAIEHYTTCPNPISHTYQLCPPGCVTPTVVATNSYGCSHSETFPCAVTISPCPTADFTADVTYRYCSSAPLDVVFTATDSITAGTTYCWYLDNFNTPYLCSNSRTLNYSFPVGPGCHDIRLITTRGGLSDTLDRLDYICNNPSNSPQFTSNLDTVCVDAQTPANLVLTNSNAGDLTWSLSGFSGSITGSSASYSITATGTYTVTVVADYGPGCSSTITRQVLVAYSRPAAFFTLPDTFSCNVPFNVCPVIDPAILSSGCTIGWRAFQTGSGGYPSTLPNPCFSLPLYGTWNIRLIVTCGNNCSDTFTRVVRITRIIPKIGLINNKGCAPVCFTASDQTSYAGIPDPISSVCWSFPGTGIPDTCSAGFVQKCTSAPGCNDIRLTITTSTGCTETVLLNDSICVGSSPTCSLTAAPNPVCYEADPIFFTLSCAPPVTNACYALVNYDDPVGSNTWIRVNALPTFPTSGYIFQNPGVHCVKAMVICNGCTDSTIYQTCVTVNYPVAKFASNSSCASANTINFTNQSVQATSYVWTFNCPSNTETSTLTNPSIVFPPCETCTAELTATNSNTGCTHTISRSITTNCTNTAIAPNDTAVCVGRNIRFTNTSPSSILTSTRWDFDTLSPTPGVIFTNTGASVLKNYTAPGNYIVAMRNTSTANCLDTTFARVRVCDTAMDYTFNNACFPTPICFNATVADSFCPITSILWDFGDGQTNSSSLTPCHSYVAPGNYTTSLTIRRDTACFQTISKTVVSVGNLNYNYRVDTVICPGVQHCITNTSSGTNLTFSWEIPDGNGTYNVDTSYSPSCFSISNQGDFPAYFSVSSDSICFNRDTLIIHVRQPLAQGYVSVDTLDCPNPPTPVLFYDTSQYVNSRTWAFGDGRQTFAQNPTILYSIPGEYIVNLTVSLDSGRCSSSVNIDTILVKGPQGFFTTDPQNGVCFCSDSLSINVNSIYATKILLLYGCQVGSISDTIVPAGAPLDTSYLNYRVPYCMPTGLDTCRPQLLLTDANQCQVYYQLPVEIITIDTPVIGYSFQNFGVCYSGNVCFQDTTKYKFQYPLSYTLRREWDFGDSTPVDTSQSPCHFYANPGAYYPTLRIWSNVGCFDSLTTQLVVVSDYPDAAFYADDTIICEDNTVFFFDSSDIYQYSAAAYWTWDFGDNSPVITNYSGDTSHFYPNGGDYRVTMCVYDTLGCADCDSSVVIHVIADPVADAGADRVICYGVPTDITGSGANACQWFPQGLFAASNICNPTITLLTDTTVVLEVGDQYGCTDTDTVRFSVGRVFADFTAQNAYCLSNNVCPADISTSANGVVNSWTWDFGDVVNPGTQTGRNACHQYADTGFKTIFLTAMDNNGCMDTLSKTIYIYSNPVAAFTLNDSIICSNQQLCVTDLSTSGSAISTWSWNYGCLGCNAQGNNPPCYTYNPPYLSNYDVSLIIVDANNCRDTATIPVIFYVAPNADFSWNPSCEDECMPLTSTSVQGTGAISLCTWSFGVTPPVTDNNCNTCYQFPPGPHSVSYAIADINGCADTVTKTVFTDSLTQLSVNPGDTTVCLGTAIDYVVGGIYDTLIWTPDVWISNPNSSVVTINPLGNVGYIITAVNGVCDPANDTITIRVIQPLPIEIMAVPDRIVLGMNSQITTQIPGPIQTITWTPDSTLSCNNCLNPVATPTQTTTYYASITFGQNGITCTNEGSITIYVLNSCNESIIYLPNTFTPNGDGLNDVFMIRGIAASKVNYFRIFDRWGKLVFEKTKGLANTPDGGWDGNDRNGNKLEPGVFVFAYEIECLNGDVVNGKGNVSLIR